jgi:hypothetical protein
MENLINIGELDTLVTLLSPTPALGTEGEKKSTYARHSDVFARIDRNVAEQLAYDNYDGKDNAVLTIYKVPGMNTRWQVEIGGHRYEILSIDPITRVSPLCEVNVQSID